MRRGRGGVVVAVVVLFMVMLSLFGVLCIAQDDWPMYGLDLWNTAFADMGLGGILFPIEVWSYETDNLIGSGSPVVGAGADGVPFVALGTANFANTGGIYVFDKEGSLLWKAPTGDYGTYATPPLADIDASWR